MNLKEFLETGNLASLYALMRADYPAFTLAITDWYKNIGYGTGLTLKGMEDTIKRVGPALLEEQQAQGPEKIDMAKVLTLPPEERVWVVDGLLFGGGLGILSADPKCGKSTLARWLACCVMAGHPFLGRACPKGRVLYYSLEDPDHVVAEDMQAFARHLDLSWADVEHSSMVFHKRTAGDIIERMEQTVEQQEIGLVVIDTLIRFLGVQGESDYGAMTAAMDALKRPLTRPGSWANRHTFILCLHHNNKAGGGGDVYKAQLGSTSLRGSTDLNLSMTVGKEGMRVLHRTEGRIKRHLPKTHIIQRDGYIDWAAAPEEGAERDVQRVQDGLEFLADQSEGVTKREVQDYLKGNGLGMATARWAKWWAELEVSGVVRVDNKKVYFVGGLI